MEGLLPPAPHIPAFTTGNGAAHEELQGAMRTPTTTNHKKAKALQNIQNI